MNKILSIKESPRHPKFSELYQQVGFIEDQVTSIRKANAYIKSNCPILIVSEFFYAYGTNYSSCHICNLDVLFVTMQKYQCAAKLVAFVDKSELAYIDKLSSIYPLDHFFSYPVDNDKFRQYLSKLKHN